MKTTLLAVVLALACAPLVQAKEGERPQRLRAAAGERPGAEGPLPLEGFDAATREKLRAAHAAAEKDPAVIKAREDMKKAAEAARAAHKAAMLKADPSLADALDKIEARMKERREKMQEQMRERREKHEAGKPAAE